jgi:hypothetical protein
MERKKSILILIYGSGSAKNNFTDKIGSTAINSLKLTKIYILTTKSSASASELVIKWIIYGCSTNW